MGHVHSSSHEQRGRLVVALTISAGILLVELAAGIASNSLALVADAGHVFADVAGMGLSLLAIWIADRPATGRRSFGVYRLEVLAATVNAIVLAGISLFVLYEGVRRLLAPPEVTPGIVIVVALFALVANLASALLLRGGRASSLNIRAAYLEVLGDLVGAAAVLVAGVLIVTVDFLAADAIASIAIGLLILPRAWHLFRDTIDVLLEATPKGVDLGEVRRHILDAHGVADVHDLHAWTITSGMNVLSAHVVLRPDAAPGDALDELGDCLAKDFDIEHSTFQLETAEHVRWEAVRDRAQL